MANHRSATELRRSEELVREYTADGHLYAYRDGDEHVVVSNGRDPGDVWERRVPAERTHIAPGEHLWTIPENWDVTFRVSGGYVIYHIPESDVDVMVSTPENCHLVDAWYGVKSVGDVSVVFDGELSRDRALAALKNAEEYDYVDASEEAIEALRELTKEYRWSSFERAFEESVAMFAPEAFDQWDDYSAPTLPIEGGHLWGDVYEFDAEVKESLPKGYTDMQVAREVAGLLQEERAVPNHPSVTYRMDTDAVGADYHIQALVEAGCSPAEAIDWYYVKIKGLSQTEWAESRGCGQSTVSKNIRQAKHELHW